MASRTVDQQNYRFGFNGKENDNETYGTGNALDFGGRIYDSRLGRWFSTDPSEGEYPYISPYNYVENNPLNVIDPSGKNPALVIAVVIEGVTFVVVVYCSYKVYEGVKDMVDEMGKYNPDYKHQQRMDRRNQKIMDELNKKFKQSMNENFPEDDDPWKWAKLLKDVPKGVKIAGITFLTADILINFIDGFKGDAVQLEKKIDENNNKMQEIRAKYKPGEQMTKEDTKKYDFLNGKNQDLQDDYVATNDAIDLMTKTMVEAGKVKNKLDVLEYEQKPEAIKSDVLSPVKNGYNK